MANTNTTVRILLKYFDGTPAKSTKVIATRIGDDDLAKLLNVKDVIEAVADAVTGKVDLFLTGHTSIPIHYRVVLPDARYFDLQIPNNITSIDLGTIAISRGSLSGRMIVEGSTSASSIISTFVVATEAAQLALVAQQGDVAVRTDLNKSFIHNGGLTGTMADWSELLTPTDLVLSVNGYTGAVTLTKSDVGLGNADNTSDVNKPISSATQAALDGKVDENAAITGATKTKITYDAKGLVTTGEDIAAADLPTGIDAAKIANGNVSNTEFQYLDGVTSAIQTQLDGKVDENGAIVGATKTKITYDAKGLVTAGDDLAATDLPTGIDAAKIADGSISNTEFQYLNDVSSNIQTQLNDKIAKNSTITGATKTKITYDSKGLVTAGADIEAADLPTGIDAAKLANGNVSNTEFQYLDGVTSGIQSQLDSKSGTGHTHTASNITDFDEAVQDAMSGALTDTATIDFAYDDLNNQITADVKSSSIGDTQLTTGINANKIANGNVSNTEFQYLDGVTSAIQTQIDGKAATSHTHTASAVTDFDTAVDGRITLQKGNANGLATLDANSKVPTNQLPGLALTDVYTVASEAAQLLLVAQEGDVAIRSDLNRSFVHNGGSAGTMADWSELLTPTDVVLSVAGKTGVVTLTSSDVGLGSVVNADTTTTANITDSTDKRFVTDAQRTVLTNTSGTNSGDQNIFSTVAVAGQSNVVADTTTDTLTLAAGSGISITTDASTDTVTITSTAGIADGDKGDITVSGSGGTWTIDNTAVTYAKIQDVSATDKILGRSSAGAGSVQEIDCTAAGRALLDDANAAAQRTTLGLGTLSTQDSNNISITGGSMSSVSYTSPNISYGVGGGGAFLLTNNAGTVSTSANATWDAVNARFGFGGNYNGSARLNLIAAGIEALRCTYDSSNYASITVAANGATTLDATGTGAKFTFSDAVEVPDDAYAISWNGSTQVPTKNAVYDKIESLAFGNVYLANANAFTGANTFTNATGQIFRQSALQDGVLIRGRNAGTNSYTAELVPGTLSNNVVITLPTSTSTLATLGGNTFTSQQVIRFNPGVTSNLEIGYDASNYFNFKVASNGATTINGTGTGAKFTFSHAVEVPDDVYASGWNGSTAVPTKNAVYDRLEVMKTESLIIAASDETTALTAGTNKVIFRMPYAFTVTAVRASLSTAQASGNIFTVDINETGTSILSTKLTIDNTEKTSQTAVTAPVISDSSIADDAEISVDIDQIGDGTAKGLKVVLIGYRT